MSTPSAPTSRVVRVFISSTFRDFGEERDLLMKRVFPELRRRAYAPRLTGLRGMFAADARSAAIGASFSHVFRE